MNEPHVLVVDDHEIVRYGLQALIGEHFPEWTVEEADNYEAMVEVLLQKTCTHVILDLQLKEVDLLQKLPQIRMEYPDLYIMVHTMSDTGWVSDIGVDAFLSKQSGRREMIAVLTLFLQYNRSVKADVHRRQGDVLNGRRERPENPFLLLSPRELELTRLILKGETAKEIQNVLRLKSSTVSTMKNRIFRKLKVFNLVGLVKLADYCHFR